jgi:hypothetical protein
MFLSHTILVVGSKSSSSTSALSYLFCLLGRKKILDLDFRNYIQPFNNYKMILIIFYCLYHIQTGCLWQLVLLTELASDTVDIGVISTSKLLNDGSNLGGSNKLLQDQA